MSGENREPEEGRPESAEEQQRARGGSWLLIGGVLAWKTAASVAGFLLRSRRRKAREPEAQARQPEGLASPAGQLIEAGAEAAWTVARLTAAAVEKVTKEHPLLPEAQGQGDEPTGRLSDRNIDLEKGLSQLRRIQVGSFLVWCSILAAMAAGLGFLWIYWTGGNNLLLGGCLAMFLGGLGTALVFWAHWLTIHKEAVEPREELASSFQDRDAVVKEFRSGVGDVQRRTLLKWTGAAAMGMVAAMVVSLIKSLGSTPNTAIYTRVWKRGQRLMTLDNKPATLDMLQPGSMVLVFPEDAIGSEKTQTVLVRVREDLLRLPAEREDWAPKGYLAYSRICTHAGCDVGMYEATTHQLMCPCHQSTFDVLNGAQPTGGPAARPLPQLPLYADSEGVLHAADGFTEPPGPGFWGMP